jgi:Group II intron, maturase-specific domain
VDEVGRDLSRFRRGWTGYFRYGNSARQFTYVNQYALNRLAWLVAKRHRRGWGRGLTAVAYPLAAPFGPEGHKDHRRCIPPKAGGGACESRLDG